MSIDFEFACQDDCLDKMVPSDLRKLVAEAIDERDALLLQLADIKEAVQTLRQHNRGAKKTAAWMKLNGAIYAAPSKKRLAEIRAEAVNAIDLRRYDSGFFNSFGGGNVDWWQDYIRSELDAAHDFYQSQIQQIAKSHLEG